MNMLPPISIYFFVQHRSEEKLQHAPKSHPLHRVGTFLSKVPNPINHSSFYNLYVHVCHTQVSSILPRHHQNFRTLYGKGSENVKSLLYALATGK
jgi:hypothetical protein